MKRPYLLTALLLPLLFASSPPARAHCEVPCGIYDDPARFTAMLEDATTIEKAMKQIQGLGGKTDAQSLNQVVRWVNTKESHATHTMEVIGQYFMAQRIKPYTTGAAEEARYVALLTSAHAVTVMAMKCKQTVDDNNARSLKVAIESFRKVYENKAEVKAAGSHRHGDHKHK